MYICTQLFKNYFHVTVTENSPFNSMTAALNNIKEQIIQVIILQILSYSCRH